MPLDRPSHAYEEDTNSRAVSLERQEEPEMLAALRQESARGAGRMVSRLPLPELETRLRDTQRFYLDLDGTMLEAGTTAFDEHALQMLRLLLDNGAEITFLTGKPLQEVQAVVDGLPEDIRGRMGGKTDDDAGRLGILYEKGAYRYDGPGSPETPFLTTPAIERTMSALGEECFAAWGAVILERHGVELRRAGTGTHKSVLSIDLFRPGAQPLPNDPDRSTAKIDPKDPRVAAVIATLRELIDSRERTLDLRIADLGNANLEIEIPDIEKGAALARLETERKPEEGRALFMDDSGNGELGFRVANFLPHMTTGLVFHETTPPQLAELADIAVTGAVRGAKILEKAAQAKGITSDLVVVSNTPSLQRTKDNEFQNRMGAPVAIGAVVASTRRAVWIFPSLTGDRFEDYHDPRINRKFHPVRISPQQYDSQYNIVSNADFWRFAHPEVFPTIDPYDPEHDARYVAVSEQIADEIDASVRNSDPTYVSTHDFQVLPAARKFRERHPERANVRFHLFWHVPFPRPEQALRQYPAQKLEERLRWFMAYDRIGFHTEDYARNYLDLCARFADRGIRPANVLVQPISIDVDRMRRDAVEVATAKDFRFDMDELNDFFQVGVPEERREEAVMAPPERADPIKGGRHRLEHLLALAQRDPELFSGKRFLEIMVPTRMTEDERNPYVENYKGMERAIAAINATLGRKAVHTVERIDGRRDVAAAMQMASKAMFTSGEDGFNMTVAETLVNWGASRLIRPKIRRMFATERTGFVLSLQEHGLREAVPVAPSPLRDAEGFRKKIGNLLRNRVGQPRYDLLEPYFARYTLKNWIDANVSSHVRESFPRGIRVAA